MCTTCIDDVEVDCEVLTKLLISQRAIVLTHGLKSNEYKSIAEAIDRRVKGIHAQED